MINKKPTMSKYGRDKQALKNIDQAIASRVFGGSVMQAVGSKGGKRTKTNSMRDNVLTLNTQTMYGGGYYTMMNVRESADSQTCYDIFLLTDKVEEQEVMRQMKAIDQITSNFGMPRAPKLDKKALADPRNVIKKKTIANVDAKPVYYDELAEGINGYARIIKYVNHSISKYQTDDGKEEDYTGFGLVNEKSENLEIVEVTEGQFEEGKKQGYCRVISADGSCEVGFFDEDLPKGKFAKYNLDGTYAMEEGLYEGYDDQTKAIKIANYTSRITR